MTVEIYLARHATPDWSGENLQYDVLPGPPLTEKGEAEALLMGEFLRTKGIMKIYASPFERTQQTALLAAGVIKIPVVTRVELAEWRHDETEQNVHARLDEWFECVCRECEQEGPFCLVSHGGPLSVMLLNLGMSRTDVRSYGLKYGENRAAPPAGVWRAARSIPQGTWQLELVFIPPSVLTVNEDHHMPT